MGQVVDAIDMPAAAAALSGRPPLSLKAEDGNTRATRAQPMQLPGS